LTTDADRLLRYIDDKTAGKIVGERMWLPPFFRVMLAASVLRTEQKRLRRAMKLRLHGHRTSYLKDNWEECDFRYNVLAESDDCTTRFTAVTAICGCRHFGVYIWPKSEALSPASQ
jgi:hypothetical protein